MQFETSLIALPGGTCETVSISTTSAQSTKPVDATAGCVAISTVDCFFRRGANPTALSDGTDQFLPAGAYVRIHVPQGEKLAFKAATSGTVYLANGA